METLRELARLWEAGTMTTMSMSNESPDQAPGGPVSAKDKVLEIGAVASQNFAPVNQICAHFNAFHVYADEPNRFIEANHYCSHLTQEVRQCILYDGPGPKARLVGIEYMVTPNIFEKLPIEERKLWHSHVYEVKSGMLVMPTLALVPEAVWEKAETEEMKEVIKLYGKVYHLWQTDKHELPLGEPKLMTSFTADGQFDFERHVGDRDKRMGTDAAKRKEWRAQIETPEIHKDADNAWKQT